MDETITVELSLAEIHRLISALHELIHIEQGDEGLMTDVDKTLMMKLVNLIGTGTERVASSRRRTRRSTSLLDHRIGRWTRPLVLPLKCSRQPLLSVTPSAPGA